MKHINASTIKNLTVVIPASKARRESFLKTKKDSGQAGMTDFLHGNLLRGSSFYSA